MTASEASEVSAPAPVQELASKIDTLTMEETPGSEKEAVPPHLSHDPATNRKRTDPFSFGSRILKKEDNVFEFNAWDHVETDDIYKEYSETQYAKQREAPVSDFDKNRFNSDPAKWWNNFYKNNTSNFFKDRKWLQQEFPILSEVTKSTAPPCTILEVGAGAGNTAFPILQSNENPNLKVHACDFSKTAVDVMRESEKYDLKHMQADVWDAAGTELPPGLGEGSCDVVIMIFIFSALSPKQWPQAVQNVQRLLKPGGVLLFRDYGRGDLAQVRFKKGRYLEENFYIRGDGTRVYFFEQDELAEIWTAPKPNEAGELVPTGFEVEDLGVDRRMLVNRAKELKMYRCWMQGRFRKVGGTPVEQRIKAAENGEDATQKETTTAIKEDEKAPAGTEDPTQKEVTTATD